MKAAVLLKNGDPTSADVLVVKEDQEIPVPKAGEILVRVSAASVNPIDWKLMLGDFPGKKSGPTGFDVSGVVTKIGDTTETTLKVGDEIYADAAATQGTFAEYAVVQAVAACRKPSNVSTVEAAALPLAGLTALQGLVTHGGLNEGQAVCILGGSGGVGSLAIQIAKALGASKVWATGSSVELIQKLGADRVVNYKTEPVEEVLKGQDFDIVFDCVGGYEGWTAAQGGLKTTGGTFVTIVGDGGSLFTMIPGIIWRKLVSYASGPAYEMFLTNTKAPAVVDDMKKLTELVEAGKVQPVLDDRTFELTTDSVHEMIKASMSHRAKGKLVLKVNC